MTVEVSAGPAVVTYIRNPQDNRYNITFQYLENDEYIGVYLRKSDGKREDLTLDVDYMVENTDGNAGVWGVVTLMKQLGTDISQICIYRKVDNDQGRTFDSQTMFANTTENALDKLTMLYQDNQFKQYTIHAPDDDKLDYGSLELPTSSERAGKFMMFDADGKLTYSEGTDAQGIRALRHPNTEDVDESFILNRSDRAGNFISFNEKGSVKYHKEADVLKDTTYTEGENITITKDNVISAIDTIYIDATTTVHGLMSTADKIKLDSVSLGAEVNVQSDWNVLDTGSDAYIKNKPSIPAPYTLPTASSSTLGGVKIGANINISSQTISIPQSTKDIYGVIKYGVYTGILYSINWSGSSAPYTQTISISGILSTDIPIVDVVLSTTASTAKNQLQEWGKIGKITTAENQVTATCYEDKPTIDLSIQFQVTRG